MFNSYFILKYLHIISAMLMVGTGFGSALYVFFANRSGSLKAQYYTNRMVVFCDWIITTPTIIIQPMTGFLLMKRLGISIFSPWALNIYLTYAIVEMAWLPVVWLQIKMKQMTDRAVSLNEPLDPRYKSFQRYWEGLGYIGFSGAIILFYLMVTKIPIIPF